MPQAMMTALCADNIKAKLLQSAINSLPVSRLRRGMGSGDLHLLNADEPASRAAGAVGKTERDRFNDALHQRVERSGLRVAARQFGNISHEVAFFILLDNDGKRIGTLGHGANYTQQMETPLRNGSSLGTDSVGANICTLS